MPTDSFEVADSQSLDYNAGATGARLKRVIHGTTQNAIIDGVRDALVAAGWEDVGATNPRASFVAPYGFPHVDPPIIPPLSTPVTGGQKVITVQGVEFRFYDPFRESPGVSTATTAWVPMSTTDEGSFSNLITEIEAATAWRLLESVRYPEAGGAWEGWRFAFEHEIPGTEFNNVAHDQGGSGSASGYKFYSNGAVDGHGGWKLRSTMASGEWLEVWIYAGSTVFFSFTTSREGSPRLLTLSTSYLLDYKIIANQFQFALFSEGNGKLVFASQPYLQHGCQQAAVITGSGSRSTLSWTGTNTYYGRESALVQAPGTAVGPKAYVLRFTSPTLVTSQGYLLVSSAYVGVPQGTTDDAAIVGKLWDAVIVAKTSALDEEMYHRGRKYFCVFRNSGFGVNPGSLWIAYE